MILYDDHFKYKIDKLIDKYGIIDKSVKKVQKVQPNITNPELNKVLKELDIVMSPIKNKEIIQSKKSIRPSIFTDLLESTTYPLNSNTNDTNDTSTTSTAIENYYFYHEKITKDDNKIESMDDYHLIILDENIYKNISEIIKDPDLYKSLPTISFKSLYYSINILRSSFKEKKNVYVKRILDFTTELFSYKYDKMDNMMDDDILDYDYLWYYFEPNKIYKI